MTESHPNASWLDKQGSLFERGWTLQQMNRVMGFINAAGLERSRALIEHLLAIEFERLVQAGIRPDLDDYARQFPEIADQLENIMHQNVEKTQMPNPFPGEFEIFDRIGSGTFADVFLATDVRLERSVVLKTLKHRTGEHWDSCLQSLKRDAKTLGRISHPSIVKVFAWRQAEDLPYLIMQYVSGGTLAEKLESAGAQRWDIAGKWIADVAEALSVVHSAGVIHRDVKPANILLDDMEDAILTDFGIAARMDERSIAGTPYFMAPEAFQGVVSPALDVFSLGATLFFLVTDEAPFSFQAPRNTDDLAKQLVAATTMGLAADDRRLAVVPTAIENLIRDSLDRNPDSRPHSTEFAERIRSAVNNSMMDTLQPASAKNTPFCLTPAQLQLTVCRRDADGTFHALEKTAAAPRVTRDIRRVPENPSAVDLRDGDYLRIEVTASREGYVTIFNVGPRGNLNRIDSGTGSGCAMAANSPVMVAEAQVEPPSGRERLVAIWTRSAVDVTESDVQEIAATETQGLRATRDIRRIQQRLATLAADEWCATVLELDHQ